MCTWGLLFALGPCLVLAICDCALLADVLAWWGLLAKSPATCSSLPLDQACLGQWRTRPCEGPQHRRVLGRIAEALSLSLGLFIRGRFELPPVASRLRALARPIQRRSALRFHR